MAKAKFNVLTLAVNKRMRNVIELFFEHHCDGLYQLTANEEFADLIIGDLDDYNEHYSLNDLVNKYANMPIICFSINEIDKQLPKDIGHVFFLKKPIVLQQLKDTLKQCNQIISHKKSGTDKSAKQPEQKVKQSTVSALANHKLPNGNKPAKLAKPTEPVEPVKAIKKNPAAALADNALTNQSSKTVPKTAPKTVNSQKHSLVADEKTADVLLVPHADPQKEDKSDAKVESDIDVDKNSDAEENNKKNLPFIGRREDIDLEDDEMIKKISFHPQGYVYYYLKDIIYNKAKDTVLHVNISDECDFFIGPDGRFIKSPTPSSKRKAVASYYFKVMEIQEQESTMDWDEIEGELIQSDALLWELSLWAARGRLPVDTDLNQPVKLKHWPNITQYIDFPNAVKIAAAWSKNTLSIKEITDKLKIPQRYVFSFYVASQAINVLDFNKEAAPPIEKTEAEIKAAGKKVGIFRRILAHITK